MSGTPFKVGDVSFDLAGVAPYIVKAFEHGTYEAPELQLCQRYLTQRDHVCELGAGVGFLGLMMYGKVGSWVGFEANPWCYERLIHNQTINDKNFKAYDAVALPKVDTIASKFYARQEYWNSSLDPTEISFSPIHKIVEVMNVNLNIAVKGCNALICDIEGGEQSIFTVDFHMISKIDKIILEMHPMALRETGYINIFTYLRDAGFVCRDVIDHVWYFLRIEEKPKPVVTGNW